MKYVRFLFVVVLCFLFLQCSYTSSGGFVNNEQLNVFFHELYLDYSRLEDTSNRQFSVALISRNYGKDGDWIVRIENGAGDEIASFHLKNSEYDEKNNIISLSECNNSGVYGYAIVDWSVIENHTENTFSFSPITNSAFDLSNSPRIKNLVEAKVVYVSSSEGDDASLGISSKNPIKTIAAAKTRQKDILLKCGDVFNESVYINNVNVSSYGQGPKPIVSGWKRLVGKEFKNVWQEGYLSGHGWVPQKGSKIWRLDLQASVFCGRTNLGNFGNNIGLIMNNETKCLYGHKCQHVQKKVGEKPTNPQEGTYLSKNFDFSQTSKKGNEGLTDEDFRYLYMYLDSNPNELDLSFSTYSHGFSITNTSVSNIRVEGFSCHGFSCGSNVKIEECEIEYIGGAQQLRLPYWIRFGNGVEIYLSKKKSNCRVLNNVISHVFDCATTIQGSDSKDAFPENIIFEKNRISECRQAFEHFLNNVDSKTGALLDYVNCKFVNNVCINNGENGFSSPEKRDACILSYEKKVAKNLEISNNVFWGSNFYYGRNKASVFENNHIYYFEDQYVYYPSSDDSEAKSTFKKKDASSNVFVKMKRGSIESKSILDGLGK